MNLTELGRRFSQLPRIQRTRFVVADGTTFTTTLDPLDYLTQHGIETPQGRIVGHIREGGKYPDPRNQSLYNFVMNLIDKGIEQGGLEHFLEIEGDEV